MAPGDRHEQEERTILPELDELEGVLERLRLANKECPVIVEGRRDRDALQRLGLEGEIITIHSGGTLYDFAEELIHAHKTIILLPDWDDRGELLYGKLASLLRGIYERHESIRNRLIELCSGLIKEVEEIPSLLEYLKEKKRRESRQD